MREHWILLNKKAANTRLNISQGHCIFITRLYSNIPTTGNLSQLRHLLYIFTSSYGSLGNIKDLRHRIGHRYGEKKGKNDRKEGTYFGLQTG